VKDGRDVGGLFIMKKASTKAGLFGVAGS